MLVPVICGRVTKQDWLFAVQQGVIQNHQILLIVSFEIAFSCRDYILVCGSVTHVPSKTPVTTAAAPVERAPQTPTTTPF